MDVQFASSFKIKMFRLLRELHPSCVHVHCVFRKMDTYRCLFSLTILGKLPPAHHHPIDFVVLNIGKSRSQCRFGNPHSRPLTLVDFGLGFIAMPTAGMAGRSGRLLRVLTALSHL